MAARGGLARNSSGFCSKAFVANYGRFSITRAKLKVANLGLQMAWESGHRRIDLQLDSQAAILISIFFSGWRD
ncbi:hypothetical protein LINPERPRIM_LOCUS6800 [Linum perenne]